MKPHLGLNTDYRDVCSMLLVLRYLTIEHHDLDLEREICRRADILEEYDREEDFDGDAIYKAA